MSDSGKFDSVRIDKLSEQISRQLLWAIADGRYHPGDHFPGERDLARAFSASRIVVREALGLLNARGIVSVRQGIGTTVNPMSKWNSLDPEVFMVLHSDQTLEQLLEVRRIVEPESAFLAAQRITDEQVQKLRPLAILLDDDSIEQKEKRDSEFHLEVANAAQNAVLLQMVSSISNLFYESLRRTFTVPGAIGQGHRGHQEIMSAIESRDAEAARRAMRDHLDLVKQHLDSWRSEHQDYLTSGR